VVENPADALAIEGQSCRDRLGLVPGIIAMPYQTVPTG
jgi:hypothetical protein